MLLLKFSFSSLSAGQMNMNGSGAYVYQVANCLNNLMYSGTQYNYYEVYNTIFANNVVYSLDNDRPVVAHVKGSRLPAGGKYFFIRISLLIEQILHNNIILTLPLLIYSNMFFQ